MEVDNRKKSDSMEKNWKKIIIQKWKIYWEGKST